MDQLLLELIELVKSASPVIWAALMKQVYVQVMQAVIWGALFMVGAVVSGIYLRKFLLKWAAYNTEDRESEYYYKDTPDHVMALTISFATALIGLTPLVIVYAVNAASRLINPEYYAIQLLLEQLR